MAEYNCAGCNQPITQGAVAVLEGDNPLYIHFNGPTCIEAYKRDSGKTLIVPRIISFSELEVIGVTSASMDNHGIFEPPEIPPHLLGLEDEL